MKKVFAILFFLGGITLIILKLFLVSDSKTASVHIVDSNVDIGKIGQYSDKEAVSVFVLRNTSKNDLVISQIVPDCNCTAFELEKAIVAMNDSVVIKLRYDKKIPGYFAHYAQVYCNTKDSPILLFFEGKIIP